MNQHAGGTNQFFAWRPKGKANAVQIGEHVTRRLPGEDVDNLVMRAVSEYPEKGTTLVLIGWQR